MRHQECDPNEVALKNYFLGPQAENGAWVKEQINHVLDEWFAWRKGLFPADGRAISERDQHNPQFIKRRELFAENITELLQRFEREVPKHSPRYIGHMFSEQSLPALFGHIVTLLHNPNNISSESSKVGVSIENEAIRFLLEMVGMPVRTGAGHFTSGGTVANIEALLRARQRCASWLKMGIESGHCNGKNIFTLGHMGWEQFDRDTETHVRAKQSDERWDFVSRGLLGFANAFEQEFNTKFAGPIILVPENKHYSWKKGISLLGLGDLAYWPIRLDHQGKLSVDHLNELIQKAQAEQRPILMVVSVAGSTELGTFDPIQDIQQLLDQWAGKGIHIWHHVDAAYGGFFRTMLRDNQHIVSRPMAEALAAFSRVDSITLDPHKLGYVPYSSGAILVNSKRNYSASTFDSPYIIFDPDRDKGAYTLEGSRSAAGAVATWMTAKCFGLNDHGHGRIVDRIISIRKNMQSCLEQTQDLPIRIAPHLESNILCFTVAQKGQSLRQSNHETLRVFERLSPTGKGRFYASKTHLRFDAYRDYLNGYLGAWNALIDDQEVVLIRLCIMNPFFDSKEMQTRFIPEFIQMLREEINTP